MRLRTLIGEIGAEYDRRLPMSSEAQMLLRQARVEFEQWLPAGHRAEGSGGRGGAAAATPRIAVFNTDETGTVRRGMYVAYLFAADMSTVTLTLSQGIAEIAEQLGRARARRALAWAAADIRAALSPGDIADLDTTVDLRTAAPQAVDVQRATILARTYQLTALPDEPTMVADLQRFIRLYGLALDARGRVAAASRRTRERTSPSIRLAMNVRVGAISSQITWSTRTIVATATAATAVRPPVTPVRSTPTRRPTVTARAAGMIARTIWSAVSSIARAAPRRGGAGGAAGGHARS